MSDTVKLIIEIPKPMYESVQNGTYCGTLYEELKNGIPLDSNSERAEVQAYFDGEAYGWEEGRKALLDDVKAEIVALPKTYPFVNHIDTYVKEDDVLQILDNIGKAESKDPNNLSFMFDGVTAFKGWTTEEMLEQIRAESEEKPNE